MGLVEAMSNAPALRQSRNGKKPVAVPKGVVVTVADGRVSARGPGGESAVTIGSQVEVEQNQDTLRVRALESAGKDAARLQGLVRAQLNNLVTGADAGFKLFLDFVGVGYRVDVKDRTLTMNVGLSHQVVMELPLGLTARVETIDQAGTKRPRLHLASVDKALLGRVAAQIRSCRPPEPYKGKGIRLQGEVVRQKVGKSGSK